jgi:D-alanine-D-alanine ligase
VASRSSRADAARLHEVERRFAERASEVAVFLIYDRPDRINERPELARSFLAERCVSDEQLDQMIDAYRSVGAYVELFEGDKPFIEALANGRLASIPRPIKLAYDGSEGGVVAGGFKPGRKSLIPAVADAYGVICANSNAYACAIGRHKFHYATLLRALGIRCPRTWHFRPEGGWTAGNAPELGLRVIVKSTFESWSVGVSADSVFVVDDTLEGRVRDISERIGQPATVQEFIAGREIYVPLFACPELILAPPVQALVARACGDPEAIVTIDDILEEEGISHPLFDSDAALKVRLQQDAADAFEALELECFARLDFKVDSSGQPWLFDVAVSPGIGGRSAAYRSLTHLGFDYPEFLRLVVGVTLAAAGII